MSYAKGMFLSFLIWSIAVLVSYFNSLYLGINNTKTINMQAHETVIHRGIDKILKRYKFDNLYNIHCIVSGNNISEAVFYASKNNMTFWERYFFYRRDVSAEILYRDGYFKYITLRDFKDARNHDYSAKRINISSIRSSLHNMYNDRSFEFIIDLEKGLILYSGEENAILMLKDML